jgi:flagellin
MRVLRLLSAAVGTFVAGSALADANLVANPGFETGDFTGWTLSGETRPDHSFVSSPAHYPGWDEWLPHNGNAFAALGAIGSDIALSQSFATTPGETYTFSFHLGSDGETPNGISARWNGSVVLAKTDEPETPGHDLVHGPPANAYTIYSFTGLATGPTTVIAFDARNHRGWWALDDVSVTLPEPSSLASSGACILALAACAQHRRRRG